MDGRGAGQLGTIHYGKHPHGRWARGAAVALLLVLAPAVGAAGPRAMAQPGPVPGLAGERLQAVSGTPGEEVLVACGAPSTVRYTAAGVATGPYPGTFEEAGTVASNLDRGVLTIDYDISFTIISGETTVTGTKKLELRFQLWPFGEEVRTAQAQQTRRQLKVQAHGLRYEATIETPQGTVVDSGTTNVRLAADGCPGDPGYDATLVERFRDADAAAPPPDGGDDAER